MVISNDFSAQDIYDFSQYKFETKMRSFTERPRYITWEITNACNLRCKHCILPNVGKPLKDELNTKDAFEVVSNIADSGAKTILFSGGEPLVREDILEVASYASRYLVSIHKSANLLPSSNSK